ncbi:alpha/beta fold hydrolase [Saccharolobus caldissimus]|uniref:Alpha/beta hydrolase n=1 Tax=Saccharolobus caldissimus TaxID=1702097 RepID=A0AAQ4CMI3_9CREN|nr:alpha/beta hydrolase [Saccharolobus caldissimus]BDB97014.1 alpha/beta hydrolase [Saccharolobus caldissimus]
MPFVFLDNIRLYYEIHGSGKPVVFIHHLAGSYKSWKYIIPNISLENFTISYDLRGHGRSSVPPNTYYIEDHSSDLKTLLSQLGVERPILVGHSIGSLIAIDYATKYPVEKLILIGALYKAPQPEVYDKYVRIALNFGMRALAEYRRLYREFSQSLLNNYEAWNSLLEVYMETNPLGYKNTVEGLIRAKDYSEDLRKLDIKTLVIYGSDDALAINSTIFKNTMKDVEIKVINGYGHFLNFEEPIRLSELIMNFL